MAPSILIALNLCAAQIPQQNLYTLSETSKPRLISFENPSGAPGSGGKSNQTAKGHPSDNIAPGKSCTLMDYKGQGIVRHIWLTVADRKPAILRALKIEMFWDGSQKPAVSVPLGDFFGTGLSERLPFESALFADPEGRSFNCSIPMPFQKSARIVLTNESAENTNLFYSISLSEEKEIPKDAGYFCAYWHRLPKNIPGADYEVLPHVTGKGRFLGSNIGIVENPLYKGSWFGEGEVKMYLDGDNQYPTLNGTGTEDYIGSAWGQGPFTQMSSGCTVAGQNGRWAFYKFHLDDPIYFTEDCRVTIQELGGAPLAALRKMKANGANFIPVAVASDQGSIALLDMKNPPDLDDPKFPDGWVNFYRDDDYSSTAYFYLDRPYAGLPDLQPVGARTEGL